jgi:hypothetical protein
LHRRKTRTRPLELGAAALAALCLGACGGEGKRASPPPPTLPHALAATLAARSDAVAAALAAGNSCGAFTSARRLQREAIAAINGGRVAPALQEDLSSAVNDLAARVTCVPPPAPTKAEGDGKKHKEKGHGNKKKQEKDD